MKAEEEAEQRYPDRPINLPEGPAVVVPAPERRAFIAGAAWQAVGVTSPEDVETRARELAGSWAVTPPESKAFTDCADTIAALRRELDKVQYLLKRMKEARAQSPDWEKLWAEQSTRAEEQVERLTRERDEAIHYKELMEKSNGWAEVGRLTRERDEAHAIIARVLGIDSYEGAHGKAIDELVKER